MTGRSRLLMTLAPGAIVTTLLCATAPLTVAIGPGPCPAPPPCSPDGSCMPKCDTWGWYPTRWRAFPGDAISPKPTAADAGKAPATPESDLRGPQLPDSTKESLIGPEKPVLGAAPAGPAGAAPATEPGAAPAEPPAAGPGAAEPGAPLPGDDLPGLPGLPGGAQPPVGTPAPGTDADPFSALPPAPPWLVEQAEATNDYQSSSVDADVAPAVDFEPAAAPHDENANLHSDDAPPEMPASLLNELTSVPPRYLNRALQPPVAPASARVAQLPPAPSATSPESAPAAMPLALPPVAPNLRLAQPKSIVPSHVQAIAQDRGIVPAAATATPDNIQLINPAVALVGDDANTSPEPAVYFEASDMPPSGSAVQHAAP